MNFFANNTIPTTNNNNSSAFPWAPAASTTAGPSTTGPTTTATMTGPTSQRGKTWSQGEIDFLCKQVGIQGRRNFTSIGQTLGRTGPAVRAKARELGLLSKKASKSNIQGVTDMDVDGSNAPASVPSSASAPTMPTTTPPPPAPTSGSTASGGASYDGTYRRGPGGEVLPGVATVQPGQHWVQLSRNNAVNCVASFLVQKVGLTNSSESRIRSAADFLVGCCHIYDPQILVLASQPPLSVTDQEILRQHFFTADEWLLFTAVVVCG